MKRQVPQEVRVLLSRNATNDRATLTRRLKSLYRRNKTWFRIVGAALIGASAVALARKYDLPAKSVAGLKDLKTEARKLSSRTIGWIEKQLETEENREMKRMLTTEPTYPNGIPGPYVLTNANHKHIIEKNKPGKNDDGAENTVHLVSRVMTWYRPPKEEIKNLGHVLNAGKVKLLNDIKHNRLTHRQADEKMKALTNAFSHVNKPLARAVHADFHQQAKLLRYTRNPGQNDHRKIEAHKAITRARTGRYYGSHEYYGFVPYTQAYEKYGIVPRRAI